MEYRSRGLRRRGDSDKWQVILSHKDPLSGEWVPSYHTIEAKTEKKAEKARDALILDLERKGSSYTSKLTVQEFLDMFVQYKEDGMPFEVNANSMERTLCDKAFALCDYYLAGEELRRHSRHIYDLRKLQGLVSFNEELAALFAAVRKQRLGKPRCLSADPSVDLAAVLRDLAENDVYKRDYIDVTTDLLYDDMPYEEAVKAIYELPGFVSGIDWSNCLDLSTADYSRIFAKNADDLEAMLAASEATPLEECVSMEDGIKDIAERINR